MRWLAAMALFTSACTGDILPIELPGPQFTTEAGNLAGPMHSVRGGPAGPLASGGGLGPLLFERDAEGGWIPLDPPDDWDGTVHDFGSEQGGALFMAGDDGRFAAGDRDRLTVITSSTGATLRALFARAPNDVFIASDAGLLHYDGERIAPASSAPAQDLFAVWGINSSVFAAGSNGVVLQIGAASVMPTETGTTATIRALHGRSRTEVYAAGGDDRGVVLRWDGARWTNLTAPGMPPLRAVFAGMTDVWVCGTQGFIARWDGTRWLQIPTETGVLLSGVFEESGAIYVTGGNEDPEAKGFIVRYGE